MNWAAGLFGVWLLWTSLAWGECAWLLWEETMSSRGVRPWTVVSSHGSYDACVAEL